MPDRCCVTACKSNYDKTGEYVSVFQFPKDETVKHLWIKKIPRENFVPSDRSVVCEKHFTDECIIRYDEYWKNNELVKVQRSRPKLKAGSIPTLFPGCPKYLSEASSSKRMSRDEKIAKTDERKFNEFLANDRIKSFDDFNSLFKSKIELPDDVLALKTNKNITLILFIDFDNCPEVVKSIKIAPSLSLQIFIGSQELDSKQYSHLLSNGILTFWSRLENIVSMVKSASKTNVEVNDLDVIIAHFHKLMDQYSDCEKKKKLIFICEQLKLALKPKTSRRYSTDMYRFAASLFVVSPSCYRSILNCKMLTLPCVDSIKKLLNVLSLNCSTTVEDNIHYIKAKCEKLTENERLVNLSLDEIYIKPKTGFSENKENVEATSIQAFMIASIYSPYEEVVALVPVSGMTAEDLLRLTKEALCILHKANFNVISLIADNNAVNRNMFKELAGCKLSSEPSINPASGAPLYLIIDPVHIMKTIRNNWICQADVEKTFVCPVFNNLSNIMKPRFCLLRNMFQYEKQNAVKLAFKLNVKTVYPTKMERQNVLPALNVFHESNSAALEQLSEKNIASIHTVEDTIAFLKLIKRWWDILNVSHENKGIFIRSFDSLPLSEANTESFEFLENFLLWIKKWQEMKQLPRQGCFSKETFFALIQTTSTIVAVSKRLLENGARYVLTTKFHSDVLEFRFSRYRQLSGSNYHVSLQQVLESERKLRVKSLLKLHSKTYGDISLRLFFSDFESPMEKINIEPFIDILEDLNVSCDNIEILTYITGYCVYKLNVDCDACYDLYLSPFDLNVDFDTKLLSSETEKFHNSSYLDMLNRGGLKNPSCDIVYIVAVCFAIFQKLISSKYEKLYQSLSVNQHNILVKLTELHLYQTSIVDMEQICEKCNYNFSKRVLKVINSFSNVCLNNYSKAKTDECVLKKMNKIEMKKNNVNKKRKAENNNKEEKRKLDKFSK